MLPRPPGLGRNFARLWTASAASNLGDGIRVAALPLLAAALTRDPAQVAGIAAVSWVPVLVFALHSGVVVDRVDKRLLMRNCQLLRLVLVGLLAGAVAAGYASIPLLYVMGFLLGAAEVLFDTAAQALIPRTVPRGDLESANSRLVGAEVVANGLVGPPVGGLLFAAMPALPFAADAVTFAAGATLLQRMEGDFGRQAVGGAPRTTASADIVEGLRWLAGHRLMRTFAVAIALVNLAASACGAILVLFALETLGLSEVGYGLLLTTSAVGGLLATPVAAPLARRAGQAPVLVGCVLLLGFALALTAFTSDPVIVGALQGLSGLAVVTFNIVGRAMRQAMAPDRLLGRVTSSFRLVGLGSIPLGSIAGGLLASIYGLPAPFLVGGVLVVVTGVALIPMVNARTIAEAYAALDTGRDER